MNDTCACSFRFLKGLAADLARGNVTFPTFNQATMRVRAALDRPDINAEELGKVISTEPLLAARLVQMANSAAMNPGGRTIGDVRSAVLRVGMSSVRSVAVAVALEQLREVGRSPGLRPFAEATWRHSVQVAAVAYVLARRLSRINPDEALFAGLVHDIGHFYLLSQIGRFPELAQDPDEVADVLANWHASIGQAVLHDFHLSDAVIEAVGEHEAGHYRLPLRTLAHIVALANLASSNTNPVAAMRMSPPAQITDPDVLSVLADGHDEIDALAKALRG